MKKPCIIAALTLMALTTTAYAEKDTRTPMERYEGTVEFSSMMCSLTARIHFMQAESGRDLTPEERKKSDFRSCIETQKKELRVAYEAANRTIKKPGARAALKEHYIAAVNALTGIAPEFEELKIKYDSRQGANQTRLQEMWNRFEAEN